MSRFARQRASTHKFRLIAVVSAPFGTFLGAKALLFGHEAISIREWMARDFAYAQEDALV